MDSYGNKTEVRDAKLRDGAKHKTTTKKKLKGLRSLSTKHKICFKINISHSLNLISSEWANTQIGCISKLQ